jgi:hypothetical protein
MDNLKKKLFSEKTITVMRRFSKWLKLMIILLKKNLNGKYYIVNSGNVFLV